MRLQCHAKMLRNEKDTQKINKGPSALEIVKKKYGKSVMKMEARDEYGDPVGGPKISKKQKAKNLSSNTPDEQHTTTTTLMRSVGRKRKV